MKILVQKQSNSVHILFQSISRSKVVSAAMCLNSGQIAGFFIWLTARAIMLRSLGTNLCESILLFSCAVIQSLPHLLVLHFYNVILEGPRSYTDQPTRSCLDWLTLGYVFCACALGNADELLLNIAERRINFIPLGFGQWFHPLTPRGSTTNNPANPPPEPKPCANRQTNR